MGRGHRLYQTRRDEGAVGVPRSILVTQEIDAETWRVRQGPGELITLIGWRTAPELEVDAGPPAEVALIIARALTRHALVTFPLSEAPRASSGDVIRTLKAGNPLQQVKDRFERITSTVHLVATREPESLTQVFEDGRFSWPQQTTFALLSALGAKAPDLDRAQVLGISKDQTVDPEWRGALAALLPGVDGTVAALVCRDGAVQTEVLADLRHEAETAGYGWRVCSAAGFADDMACGRP